MPMSTCRFCGKQWLTCDCVAEDKDESRMETLTLKEIASAAIRAMGLDGLVSVRGNCACLISDLMPCGEPSPHCEAGHRTECDGSGCDGDCDFHITAG